MSTGTGAQSSIADEIVPEAITTVQPLQIRGRFFTAVALRPGALPDQAFYEALDSQLQRMPHFFENAPFVIDLELTPDMTDAATLNELVAALRRRRLSVFGVQNASNLQADLAVSAGLIALPGGRDVGLERVEKRERRVEKPAETAARAAAPGQALGAAATRIVTEPVRSGQKIFADRGDLVVVASVGSGAELVAAGNIHVYGQLRGRALAGVNGDESARIFCQSLDAELLAVAGLYQTSEDISAEMRRQSVQVYLRGHRLCIEPLG